MGWKQCVTGSYDYLNDKGEIIFHIFRKKNVLDLPHAKPHPLSRWAGQVFYGDQYSVLVYEEELSVFIMKCLVVAKNKGWDISIDDFDLNPDLSNLEEYESEMYLDNYEAIEKINKERSKLKGDK